MKEQQIRKKRRQCGSTEFRRFPVHIALYVAISIVAMELALRWFVYRELFGKGILYTLMFDAVFIIGILLASSLSKKVGVNRVVAASLLSLFGLYFAIQIVYQKVFQVFFTLYSFGGAGQVLQFMNVILLSIAQTFGLLAIVLGPAIALFFLKRSVYAPHCPWGLKAVFVALAVAVHIGTLQLIKADDSDAITVDYIYSYTYAPETSVRLFGMLTTLRLDVTYLIADVPTPPSTTDPVYCDVAPSEEDKGYNIVESLNFRELIQNETNATLLDMHKYFNSLTPTSQSPYTGWFEGKNLILIIAESFSPYVIDEQRTPTLYKLANEGFRFTNFYSPLWRVSTSDGEYVALTGLVPVSGIWSLLSSKDNFMAFCLGNQLRNNGYATFAYHNHFYSYYGRNRSHPNLGYTYKGINGGLDIPYTWPSSDLDMMQATYDKYASNTPFHIYYLTVSGHLNYTRGGNRMVSKNWSTVRNLSYSANVKGYLSCNYELEKALAYLYGRLEADGMLEDTVIALAADHYPYGLTNAEYFELAGEQLETNFEMYRSSFILWSGCIETPIVIDKPCSNMDITPTLSNLFGIEYDSRLMAGTDILSDSPALVIFNNRSFITDKGRYNSVTGAFTANEGETVSPDYVSAWAKIVNDKFTYSEKILTYDYYSKVLK